MGAARPRVASLLALAALAAMTAPALPFAAPAGWSEDRTEEAFAVFRRSCAHLLDQQPDVRLAVPPPPELRRVCRLAMALPAELDRAGARRFFEAEFEARPVDGPPGLMTGYYEPEFEARLQADARFRFPLFGRPDDLVAFAPNETPPPGLEGLAGARRRADGGLEPYPDRAAIEDGALAGRGLELAWLADPFEAFLIQVQGSSRLRIGDGTILRVAYAGRTGHPYTSVGRLLIEEGRMTREEADMPRIRAIFAADPELARRTMRRNRSFVFFRLLENHDSALGPIGAQGVPLTPGRSIAIDRNRYPYGLPIFVDGVLRDQPVQRLMIAQDTGTAIVGAQRVDWFAGWGAAAEELAGALRHPVRLTLLVPKP